MRNGFVREHYCFAMACPHNLQNFVHIWSKRDSLKIPKTPHMASTVKDKNISSFYWRSCTCTAFLLRFKFFKLCKMYSKIASLHLLQRSGVYPIVAADSNKAVLKRNLSAKNCFGTVCIYKVRIWSKCTPMTFNFKP